MSIMLKVERDALIEKLAIATAFLKFRAAHGGGYPKPGEVAAARQEIVSDPAFAKFGAPSETECASLLRQYGFEPPVVRRVNQKKT
jgi:ribonuclease HII